jgi:hypothetical protein
MDDDSEVSGELISSGESVNFETQVINTELVKIIEKEMSNLAPMEQDIIVMRVWDEMKFSEISQVLNDNEDSIKKKFYRSIDKIRLNLEQSDPSYKKYTFAIPIIFGGIFSMSKASAFAPSAGFMSSILNNLLIFKSMTNVTTGAAAASTSGFALFGLAGGKLALAIVSTLAVVSAGVVGTTALVLNNDKKDEPNQVVDSLVEDNDANEEDSGDSTDGEECETIEYSNEDYGFSFCFGDKWEGVKDNKNNESYTNGQICFTNNEQPFCIFQIFATKNELANLDINSPILGRNNQYTFHADYDTNLLCAQLNDANCALLKDVENVLETFKPFDVEIAEEETKTISYRMGSSSLVSQSYNISMDIPSDSSTSFEKFATTDSNEEIYFTYTVESSDFKIVTQSGIEFFDSAIEVIKNLGDTGNFGEVSVVKHRNSQNENAHYFMQTSSISNEDLETNGVYGTIKAPHGVTVLEVPESTGDFKEIFYLVCEVKTDKGLDECIEIVKSMKVE